MAERASTADPVEVMRREMRVCFGAVPASVPDPFYAEDGVLTIATDAFVFRTPGGVGFHYQRGTGLTVESPVDAAAGEESDFELFLWGTVFGTVAWLNGLIPLHASSVDAGGRVVAFTADSGGGKSTLAASLAALGLPHVCDDTLVVSLAGNRVTALADEKSLKLWGDALSLLGMNADRPIPAYEGKFYASAPSKAVGQLPFTDLVFLEQGESVAIEPITGAEKLAILPAALYRGFVHLARGDRSAHERMLLTLGSQVRFWRLSRPFDAPQFSDSILKIKDIVMSLGDGNQSGNDGNP